MVLKIVGYGFFTGPEPYIKDAWNILDFFIVMSSYVTVLSEMGHSEEGESVDYPVIEEDEKGISITGLRVFRVMRPLKTISSIKGLRVLIVAVLSALPMLQDTLMILMFFFIVFATATTQMFNGMLKQRCINIQTGTVHPDDIMCTKENTLSCPGGFFCGKSNENPNYGVTNFDNIAYSFLAVFQCLTLEGWSEIQRDMQRTYITGIYIMFIPMVLIGAFFLLNLTLAVINSKFTEMNNKQTELDKIELQKAAARGDEDQNNVDDGDNKNDLNMTQFTTAKVYAKKMIEFLRLRQEIKRIEQYRQEKSEIKNKIGSQFFKKQEQKENLIAKNKLQNIATSKKSWAKVKSVTAFITAHNRDQPFAIKHKVASDKIINEDIHGETNPEYTESEVEPEYDIKKFLENGKIGIQRRGMQARNFRIPHNINEVVTRENLQNQNVSFNLTPNLDIDDSMKEHMLPPKTNFLEILKSPKSELQSPINLAEELDIDKVITNRDDKNNDFDKNQNSIADSFQLSENNHAYGNNIDRDKESSEVDIHMNLVNEFGLQGLYPQPDLDSGLITSDSDFDDAVAMAMHHDTHTHIIKSAESSQLDLYKETKKSPAKKISKSHTKEFGPKNVSKKFKAMLSNNFNRTEYQQSDKNQTDADATTKQGETRNEHTDQSSKFSKKIERKFITNQNTIDKNWIKKTYKEDQEQKQTNLTDQYKPANKLGAGWYQDTKQPIQPAILKTDGQDIRTLYDFVDTNVKFDPFQDINPLTQKIEIAKNQKYKCTSQNDVLIQRDLEKQKVTFSKLNPFLIQPQDKVVHEEDQDEYVNNDAFHLRLKLEPYQQKVFYQVQLESSESGEESLNEDEIQAEEQPYYTPLRINYYNQTKQIHTREIMKRSDLMITSTLSLSLFPKDKRTIEHLFRTEMDQLEVDEFLDERCAFDALVKEHEITQGVVREKDNNFRQNYVKSFLHRAEFSTNTLKDFKQNVIKLNKNKIYIKEKPKNERVREIKKWELNKKNSEMRGIPTFDMDMAEKLIKGTFHEEDSDNEEDLKVLRDKVQQYQQMHQNHQFEEQIDEQQLIQNKLKKQINQILNQPKEKPQFDEIPINLRHELNIPVNKGDNDIDFHKVRNHDANKKKMKPYWSGHDVLTVHMDNQKALFITNIINKNRVWPTGTKGNLKRLSFILRLHVKSNMYGNFFTFFVFLNTITLAMNKYGMNSELEGYLELFNMYFTYIFIYEMFVKIAGIGLNKYLADTMNYMDGSIVMASIFEVLYMGLGDGEDQSALSTLRVLRAVRVFRMLRLLRNLESMQTILNVMARSYMSFVYITGLMFLFIIIFTLLGMSTYGGYWKNDPLGIPPNNFDSFGYAFFTQFQVLTMENWQSVMFVQMRNNKTLVESIQSPLINILWIFLGNFILLNLFLAILLDSFLVDGEELSEEEIEEKKKKKRARKLAKKDRLERRQVIMNNGGKKKLTNFWWNGEEKLPSEEDLEDLDEWQIVEMFKTIGVLKRDKAEIDNVALFSGMHCNQSFFLFSQNNRFRIFCYKLIKHPLWESVVLVAIAFSSCKLGYDSFYISETEVTPRSKFSAFMDTFFSIAFICEMSVKLVAMGVCMDEGSYLQDEWNQMDFFIVMASIFDMALSGYDLAALKILRMLRVLRPLRFLTHNVGLKLIVNALIGSLSGIVNVLLVVAVVYLIFAIMGVNFYAGKFQFCSIDPYIIHTRQDCEFAGGSWETHDHNFDQVGRGWLTMFIVASLEGWPDIMIQAVEATAIDKGPGLNQNTAGPQLFFVIFIFIGSFFFLNFFIGVLFMKFNKAQEQEQKGFTAQDLSWMDIQRLILSAEPDYEATNVPDQEWRKKFHLLVCHPKFETFIMGMILLNMLQMALLSEGMPKTMHQLLRVSNYIFAAIFVIEAALKFIAYGASYFASGWNKFDFFVVAASIFDVILEISGGSNGGFQNITRVMRVLRVARILRLAGRAKNLQAILQTITFSIPALGNVFILLMLIYFMMAVLANFVFYQITEGEVIDPDYKNFRDIQASFILLFALSTGEDWNKVMFDCSRSKKDACVENLTCGSPFAFLFFPGLIIICSYVMLNLFILVIIQQFEKYYLPEENMLGKFKTDLQTFMKVWRQLTQDRYRCLKIKENQLTSFFRKLGAENDSLGFTHDKYDDGELKKYVLRMAIKSQGGYIYFNEMLYRCMRRKYGNMKINKRMQLFELRTQYSIFQITLAQKGTNAQLSNDDIFNSIIKKRSSVNPFLTVMNFKISFKTWLKGAREQLNIECKAQIGHSQHSGHHPALSNRKFAIAIDHESFHEYTSDEQDKTPDVTPKDPARIHSFHLEAPINQDSLADLEKHMIKKLKEEDVVKARNSFQLRKEACRSQRITSKPLLRKGTSRLLALQKDKQSSNNSFSFRFN